MVFHYALAVRLSSSGVCASGNQDLPWDVINHADVRHIHALLLLDGLEQYSCSGPNAVLGHEAMNSCSSYCNVPFRYHMLYF